MAPARAGMPGERNIVTPQTLRAATGCMLYEAQRWAEHITAAMDKYDITTPARQAAFLAQVAHESGRFVYVREIWGPTPAQRRYEGNKKLGNTEPGDGFRYRGRGLIQVTGRANYRKVGQALGVGFESSPELLERQDWASESAAWFWAEHGCNELADTGDFDGISDVINKGRRTPARGDANGFEDRLAIWEKARKVLT